MVTRLAPSVLSKICLSDIRLFIYTYLWALKNNAEIHLRFDNILCDDFGNVTPPDDINKEIENESKIKNVLNELGFEFSKIYKLSDIVITAYDNFQGEQFLREAIQPLFYATDFNTVSVRYRSIAAIYYYSVYQDKENNITHIFRARNLEVRTKSEQQICLITGNLIGYSPQYIHLPLLLDATGNVMNVNNAPDVETLKSKGLTIPQIINYLYFSGIKSSLVQNKCYTLQQLAEDFELQKLIENDTIYNEKDVQVWKNIV